MTEVSVRELKNHLSEYIRRVEAGEAIVVTRRGKAVVTMSGNGDSRGATSLDEKMRDLVKKGIISRYSGKKFVPSGKPTKMRGKGPSGSEMILEDRG